MKRLLTILFCSLIWCCSSPVEEFATFEVNLTRDALRNNKIRYYEDFLIHSDSLVHIATFHADSIGNIINEQGSSNTLDYVNRQVTYDSLNRMVKLVSDGHVNTEYSISYDMYPEKKMVIEHWKSVDDSSAWRDYIIHYNESLDRILKRISLNANSKDTLRTLAYEYDAQGKLLRASDDKKIEIIKCDYDKDRRLIKIKRANNGDDIEIDFVSPATGLIDSTLKEHYRRKQMLYFKYFK